MGKFEEEVLGRVRKVATEVLGLDLKKRRIELAWYLLGERVGAYTISEAKRTIYLDPIALQMFTHGDDNYLAFWIAHEVGHLSSGFPKGEKKADEYAKKMLLKSGMSAREVAALTDRIAAHRSLIEKDVDGFYSNLKSTLG